MFSECANPDCSKPFNYREGHFFRFHKSHRPEVAPPNTHSVQHFWLCGKCSENYTLEYRESYGVVMLQQIELFIEPEQRHAVSVA